MEKELKAQVDLFDINADDDSMSVFDKKGKNLDGIYRPGLETAKDKSKGYFATIRLLPNFMKVGDEITKGASAFEKEVHFAKLPIETELYGYYECNKNFEPKCDLCTLYWKLNKSKNEADVEKSKLISKTSKYYSYVLVVEDENAPELEGKILVFPFGYQIKEKINQQRTGELSSTKEKINVYSLTQGKDLKLIIKSKGNSAEKITYESSSFLETSAIKLYNEANKTWHPAPVGPDGKFAEKVQEKVLNFLLKRDVELEAHLPKPWDDEMKAKVAKVIAYLSGNDVAIASRQANAGSSKASQEFEKTDVTNSTTADDFFSIEENE